MEMEGRKIAQMKSMCPGISRAAISDEIASGFTGGTGAMTRHHEEEGAITWYC